VGSEPVITPQRLRFGNDFELDRHTYELRRSGRRVRLERIPMELLFLLVEQRGQIVTRDKIIERVWGKDVFLDTDNSINAAIRKIRQVLKDDPEQPRFVQTVTGRGYRFIAPVLDGGGTFPLKTPVSRQPVAEGMFVVKAVSGNHLSQGRRTSRLPGVLLGIFIILTVGLGAYFQWWSHARPQPPAGRLMLAVLPFESLTGDAAQDYFSDGMTEEMITELGGLNPEHLGVIARTSVMFYKHNPKPLDQVGRELGVQYVLEGSVRRSADQVRVTSQLIRVQDQTHLWARQYDRELKNLLTVQSEIAHETADEIRIALGDHKPIGPPSQVSLSPQTYEAYDLYLKGQYFWNKRTVEGFEKAIEYFQQALLKDPNYARAYAGLADSYALLCGYKMVPQAEFMAKARAAAVRAIQIDGSLPEAHAALALIVQNYDWDWLTADKEFRRAIELNPNYATGHQWYAEHLSWLGRFDDALLESERARQLDPLSLIIATDHGVILFYKRQYDRAIQQFRAVLEMDPSFPHAGLIRQAYVQKGMFAEVLAEIETSRRLYRDGPWFWSEEAYVYGRLGQHAQARLAMAKLEAWNRLQRLDPSVFVRAHLGAGDNDQAFADLEEAYAEHSNLMTTLLVDPIFDPLRGDPRFQDLLRRVGLAE
jgi:TolB-like protein/DNA-binding winged helix-turn-helix (wHTH) protein/Tfp pilus assembly protein PilF